MNDLATAMAAGDFVLRQCRNLKIAKGEAMALTAGVDLSCAPTRHLELPASAGGLSP